MPELTRFLWLQEEITQFLSTEDSEINIYLVCEHCTLMVQTSELQIGLLDVAWYRWYYRSCYMIQNHGITQVRKVLQRDSLLKSGPVRAGFSSLLIFWVPPRMEIPLPFWAPISVFDHPLVKNIFPAFGLETSDVQLFSVPLYPFAACFWVDSGTDLHLQLSTCSCTVVQTTVRMRWSFLS